MRGRAAELRYKRMRPFGLQLDHQRWGNATGQDDTPAEARAAAGIEYVVEQPAAQIIDVVDLLLNIDVWDDAQPCVELLESDINRQRCTHPTSDLLIDASQKHRIVEEQQMRREDEGVFLIDFTCRCNLNSQKVIVRFLDCASHARALHGGLSRGQLPRREIESVRAPEHGGSERDAGRCADATKYPLSVLRLCGQWSWRGSQRWRSSSSEG